MNTGEVGGVAIKKKRLWPYALVALLIAIVWAAGSLLVSLPSLPQPDGTPRGNGRAMGALVGTALWPALVIWFLFYFTFLRKRLSFAKSIGGAVVVFVVTTVVVVASMELIGGRVRAENAKATAVIAEFRKKTETLYQKLNADIAAIKLAPPLANIHALADVQVEREQVQRARQIYGGYVTALDQEVDWANKNIATLEVSPKVKERALTVIQEDLGAESTNRRVIDLTLKVLDARDEMLLTLQSRKDHWGEVKGQLVFDDQASLDAFKKANAAYTELNTQFATLAEEQRRAATESPKKVTP